MIIADDDPVLMALELDGEDRHQRIRMMLRADGRPDILAEYDKAIQDIRLGITGARNVWHSISPAQRRILARLGAAPRGCEGYIGRGLPTARALCARDLLAPDGGVMNPESRFVITERGRFVLKHGQEEQ